MGSKRNIIGGNDGWLRIKTEPRAEIVSVPGHLQIELSATRDGRDFFTVLEGVHKGKRASVTTGNISPGALPLRKAVHLIFDRDAGSLTCGEVKLRAKTDIFNEIPKGDHPIQIPDFPHPLGHAYLSNSIYAKTWFYLGHGHATPGGHGGDRYLHTGNRSAGCVTVDPDHWTRLYELIIRCRSNDGSTVGSITVL